MSSFDLSHLAAPAEQHGGGELRHPPATELVVEQAFAAFAAVRPRPVSAACSTRYTALRHSGRRPLHSVLWLVVHDEEASTAEAAARWFTNPAARGSAHVCADEMTCYRTLAPSMIPWGAPGANTYGWHLELAGFAAWTRAQWLAHERTLDRGAYKLAYHRRFFAGHGAPVGSCRVDRFLTVAEIRAGRPGLVTHADVARAFPTDDPHHDPGTGFPRGVFCELVSGYVDELDG